MRSPTTLAHCFHPKSEAKPATGPALPSVPPVVPPWSALWRGWRRTPSILTAWCAAAASWLKNLKMWLEMPVLGGRKH